MVCFDKTGTLSENRLRAGPGERPPCDAVLDGAALAAEPPTGTGSTHMPPRRDHRSGWHVADAEPAAHCRPSGRPFSATVVGARLSIKGAPEVVLEACDDADSSVRRQVRDMAHDGLRVIAVAEADLTQDQSRAACADPDAFAELCRNGLRVTGLLGLSDTPRSEAAGLLVSLAEQDIGVRLITGDHPITARAIANELGLSVTADQVIRGGEWEALSRRRQEQAVAERLVFARMSPENKVQVVQTLERTGRICAMVGDGANDAAAIRAATVGIGAARGSDPARTAADVMLLDGRISGLLDALDEGRKLWLRVQSARRASACREVLFAIIGRAITARPLNTRQAAAGRHADRRVARGRVGGKRAQRPQPLSRARPPSGDAVADHCVRGATTAGRATLVDSRKFHW